MKVNSRCLKSHVQVHSWPEVLGTHSGGTTCQSCSWPNFQELRFHYRSQIFKTFSRCLNNGLYFYTTSTQAAELTWECGHSFKYPKRCKVFLKSHSWNVLVQNTWELGMKRWKRLRSFKYNMFRGDHQNNSKPLWFKAVCMSVFRIFPKVHFWWRTSAFPLDVWKV